MHLGNSVDLLTGELGTSILLPGSLVATLGCWTLFTVAASRQAVRWNALSLEIRLRRVSTTLTEHHVVLFCTTLIAVTFNSVNGNILTLEALSNSRQRLPLIPSDVGAIVLEVHRLRGAADQLDLTPSAHALFALWACRRDGVVATLGACITAAVVAVITLATLLVVETLSATTLISTLLLAGTLDVLVAETRDALTRARGALHARAGAVRVLTTLLTLCIQTVLALILTVAIVFALGVRRTTCGKKKRQAA